MNGLTKDPIRIGKVARLELLIQDYGVCGAMEMFAQAPENIQEEKSKLDSEYFESEEYLNYQHDIEVLEFVMNAVDLDHEYGKQITRTENMDSLVNGLRIFL